MRSDVASSTPTFGRACLWAGFWMLVTLATGIAACAGSEIDDNALPTAATPAPAPTPASPA